MSSTPNPQTRPRSVALARLVRAVQQQILRGTLEYEQFGQVPDKPHMQNYWFSTPGEPDTPQEVFDHLHWGGQFVYVCTDQVQAQQVAANFHDQGGFVMERSVQRIVTRVAGLWLPGFSKKGYFFIARKLLLVLPGQMTDRFTYHVQLVRNPQADYGYVVYKEVPTLDNVAWRLREKHPDIPEETIVKRARKLVENVFPIFLTRETAILNILQRDLPKSYRHRVPKVIGYEKDDRGFVRRLYLNWLRLGGETMSQIEFAKQTADLLRVLHNDGGVIHLDLRLDNFVISNGEVSFVDFGSAVRDGEDLSQSPMLTSLFEEMMRTSQIQRLLGKWANSGRITNKVIREKFQHVDKAIDFFYMAVQMNRPHHNPEFQDLVHCDKTSLEAEQISALTASILRPKDPDNPAFQSAADILEGIHQIEKFLVSQEDQAA